MKNNDETKEPSHVISSEMEMHESAERSIQQLAYMEAMVADISEGLVIADLDGNVLEMNNAALALHGYSHVGEAQKHMSKYIEDWEFSYPDGNEMPLNEASCASVGRRKSQEL